MDDGTAHGKGLRLCTHCFTDTEVKLLMSALHNKFGLKCTLHRNDSKPLIYISVKSMDELKALVLPHMCTSMLYKLGL